jgi:RNA polymerase sigma-70 factor, ECF subfamily
MSSSGMTDLGVLAEAPPEDRRATAGHSSGRSDRQAAHPIGESAVVGEAPRTFDELYEAYFAFVWRSLRMLGVAPEALDDASQDVFYAAYRRWSDFRGESSLRTWMFGISQGVAANYRRGLRRKLARLDALALVPVEQQPSPEELARATQQIDRVLSFSATLDEGRRAVFVLGLLEGVPAPEIAQLVGIPLNTVYSRVRRLREALQAWLEREGEG